MHERRGGCRGLVGALQGGCGSHSGVGARTRRGGTLCGQPADDPWWPGPVPLRMLRVLESKLSDTQLGTSRHAMLSAKGLCSHSFDRGKGKAAGLSGTDAWTGRAGAPGQQERPQCLRQESQEVGVVP